MITCIFGTMLVLTSFSLVETNEIIPDQLVMVRYDKDKVFKLINMRTGQTANAKLVGIVKTPEGGGPDLSADKLTIVELSKDSGRVIDPSNPSGVAVPTGLVSGQSAQIPLQGGYYGGGGYGAAGMGSDYGGYGFAGMGNDYGGYGFAGMGSDYGGYGFSGMGSDYGGYGDPQPNPEKADDQAGTAKSDSKDDPYGGYDWGEWMNEFNSSDQNNMYGGGWGDQGWNSQYWDGYGGYGQQQSPAAQPIQPEVAEVKPAPAAMELEQPLPEPEISAERFLLEKTEAPIEETRSSFNESDYVNPPNDQKPQIIQYFINSGDPKTAMAQAREQPTDIRDAEIAELKETVRVLQQTVMEMGSKNFVPFPRRMNSF